MTNKAPLNQRRLITYCLKVFFVVLHQLWPFLIHVVAFLGALDIEGEADSFHQDIKLTRRTLQNGQTTATANGEATANRNIRIVHVGHQHLFYTTKLKIELDGVKCAEDNTLYPFEVYLQTQHIEQSIDVVERLFHLFQEQDDILIGGQQELGTCDGRIARKVASHQHSLRMTTAIMIITSYLVLW